MERSPRNGRIVRPPEPADAVTGLGEDYETPGMFRGYGEIWVYLAAAVVVLAAVLAVQFAL